MIMAGLWKKGGGGDAGSQMPVQGQKVGDYRRLIAFSCWFDDITITLYEPLKHFCLSSNLHFHATVKRVSALPDMKDQQ
jgi:hypothetical protein